LADDISQITFINAYQGLTQYRNGSFRAWLLRIATNACYDEFRRQKRQQTLISGFIVTAHLP
jgi:RNA polymerase sigma-70 factor (ECF subfamily)